MRAKMSWQTLSITVLNPKPKDPKPKNLKPRKQNPKPDFGDQRPFKKEAPGVSEGDPLTLFG